MQLARPVLVADKGNYNAFETLQPIQIASWDILWDTRDFKREGPAAFRQDINDLGNHSFYTVRI